LPRFRSLPLLRHQFHRALDWDAHAFDLLLVHLFDVGSVADRAALAALDEDAVENAGGTSSTVSSEKLRSTPKKSTLTARQNTTGEDDADEGVEPRRAHFWIVDLRGRFVRGGCVGQGRFLTAALAANSLFKYFFAHFFRHYVNRDH
jgi:hypothetical protein